MQKSPPTSIVLLIDEYDAGLDSRLKDKAAFERVLSMLSSFFSMVKAADKAWRFVFISGVGADRKKFFYAPFRTSFPSKNRQKKI